MRVDRNTMMGITVQGDKPAMYVCICHALNDRQVKDACPGACHPVEVLHRLGARPRCGRCLEHIRGMMVDDTEQSLLLAAE